MDKTQNMSVIKKEARLKLFLVILHIYFVNRFLRIGTKFFFSFLSFFFSFFFFLRSFDFLYSNHRPARVYVSWFQHDLPEHVIMDNLSRER